ncbi:hypothetical protein, partial [Burkholderia sp. SIMBA_052]|uniref:hypothetical protein n=1 Tax=Burkholderia sp. SIMBA_052 TaxID=3085793 RepID=UPI0039787B3D
AMGHGQGVSNMRAGNSCKASDIDALVTVPDRPLWCFVEDRRYGASQPSAYLENKLDKLTSRQIQCSTLLDRRQRQKQCQRVVREVMEA